jgi:dinuclear metal center YbgI/SA1388 family protein
MPTVADLTRWLEQFAPPALAADWDNVGLLLGDCATEVRRVMTCLTVTPASAAEAVEAGAGLIVTHHPILFRGVKRLTTATAEGRTLIGLVKAGVAVYSPHTSFDNTVGGINDGLAQRLGLVDVVPLRRDAARTCKVVVFVPAADLDRVSDALFSAGAGRIGQYRECSFRLAGTGTFFGSEGANPTVGQTGRREQVAEWRLEAVCPEAAVDAVVTAMRRAHSYEEPAYDVYPLRPAGGATGEGRVGRVAQPLKLRGFAERTKVALACGPISYVGDPERAVGRVAVACGAGGEFLADARKAGADVLVTGEARFHDCLAAEAQGPALVLPGHYATERFGVEDLAERLRGPWPDLDVWASRCEPDPLRWVTEVGL